MRSAGLMLLLPLCMAPCHAQTNAPAGQTAQGAAAPDARASAGSGAAATAAVPVKLGDSSTALNGPWRFHTGDDMAWAQADFDDSGWDSVDLNPKGPSAGAGWTRRGYPGYAGFAWYRIRVNVQGATHLLALQ